MKHSQKNSLVITNDPLHSSALKTIRFFDQFQFPLTAQELLNYLYKPAHVPHIKALKATLNHLEEAGKVEQLKSYVFLSGHSEWIDKRKARSFISERLWHRAKFYTQHLRLIPFVRMVAVCNSLAYNNAKEESDIDLFIVVEEGRMWLARLIITLTLQFFGVRRYGNKVAGRFCLSFFVTPSKLDMSQIALPNEDPYLAYWVKFLSPLYGRNMYEVFKEQNIAFLKSYGLSFAEENTKHLYDDPKESRLKRFLEKLLKGALGNAIEWILKKTYKRKTLHHMNQLDERAKVVVSDDMLKFHNEDRRERYRAGMMREEA